MVLVHLSLAADEPFNVQVRVAPGHVLDEFAARFVPACKDMGDAGLGHTDRFREYGLGNILGCKKLLEAIVHGDLSICLQK